MPSALRCVIFEMSLKSFGLYCSFCVLNHENKHVFPLLPKFELRSKDLVDPPQDWNIGISLEIVLLVISSKFSRF